jgi:hypothetical protein
MGITFKAIDVNLHIPVALKVLNLRLFQEALARRRFLRDSLCERRLPNSGNPPKTMSIDFFMISFWTYGDSKVEPVERTSVETFGYKHQNNR